MPQYVIERQYLVPVYQHISIRAPRLEAACRDAIEHDDWETSEKDHDNARETTIACAVEIAAGCNCAGSLSSAIYQSGYPHLVIPPGIQGRRNRPCIARAAPTAGRTC